MYENRADHLSNNLRLNEISILIFFQFYCRINRNQLEIVVKATYGLHANKYFEILNLTFGGRSLVTRRFGLHSSSRDADKIKDLLISIYFCNKNTELLLLFSIISPCFYKRIKKVCILEVDFAVLSFRRNLPSILKWTYTMYLFNFSTLLLDGDLHPSWELKKLNSNIDLPMGYSFFSHPFLTAVVFLSLLRVFPPN